MTYSTVIFDLDGTLLNTLDDLAASVNYAMREMGFPEHKTDSVRRFVGNGIALLIERSVPEGTSEADYNKTYELFRNHYAEHCLDRTAPYSGILDMIKKLRDMGCKIAVVSNKVDFAVQKLCKDFFPGLIDAAVGDSPKTRTKPEADMVIKALEMMGVKNDGSCVYVGDMDVDLKTAENSDMDCISVSWGFRSRTELESCGAAMIADDPEMIVEICSGNIRM